MIKDLLYTIALVSMFSVSAQSFDDPANLQQWTVQAGQSISAKMKYPASDKDNGRIGVNTYKVTINRQGKVVTYDITDSAKRNSFNRASDRALKNVKFPNLPVDYAPEQLTFTLNMYYYGRPEDLEKLGVRGMVIVEEIE